MAIIGANNRNSNLIQNRGGIVDGRNIHNQQNFVQRNTANSRDTALARREYSQYLKERADEEMAEKQRIQEARSKYMAEQQKKFELERQRIAENQAQKERTISQQKALDRVNSITITQNGTAITINDPNHILSHDQKLAILTGKTVEVEGYQIGLNSKPKNTVVGIIKTQNELPTNQREQTPDEIDREYQEWVKTSLNSNYTIGDVTQNIVKPKPVEVQLQEAQKKADETNNQMWNEWHKNVDSLKFKMDSAEAVYKSNPTESNKKAYEKAKTAYTKESSPIKWLSLVGQNFVNVTTPTLDASIELARRGKGLTGTGLDEGVALMAKGVVQGFGQTPILVNTMREYAYDLSEFQAENNASAEMVIEKIKDDGGEVINEMVNYISENPLEFAGGVLGGVAVGGLSGIATGTAKGALKSAIKGTTKGLTKNQAKALVEGALTTPSKKLTKTQKSILKKAVDESLTQDPKKVLKAFEKADKKATKQFEKEQNLTPKQKLKKEQKEIKEFKKELREMNSKKAVRQRNKTEKKRERYEHKDAKETLKQEVKNLKKDAKLDSKINKNKGTEKGKKLEEKKNKTLQERIDKEAELKSLEGMQSFVKDVVSQKKTRLKGVVKAQTAGNIAKSTATSVAKQTTANASQKSGKTATATTAKKVSATATTGNGKLMSASVQPLASAPVKKGKTAVLKAEAEPRYEVIYSRGGEDVGDTGLLQVLTGREHTIVDKARAEAGGFLSTNDALNLIQKYHQARKGAEEAERIRAKREAKWLQQIQNQRTAKSKAHKDIEATKHGKYELPEHVGEVAEGGFTSRKKAPKAKSISENAKEFLKTQPKYVQEAVEKVRLSGTNISITTAKKIAYEVRTKNYSGRYPALTAGTGELYGVRSRTFTGGDGNTFIDLRNIRKERATRSTDPNLTEQQKAELEAYRAEQDAIEAKRTKAQNAYRKNHPKKDKNDSNKKKFVKGKIRKQVKEEPVVNLTEVIPAGERKLEVIRIVNPDAIPKQTKVTGNLAESAESSKKGRGTVVMKMAVRSDGTVEAIPDARATRKQVKIDKKQESKGSGRKIGKQIHEKNRKASKGTSSNKKEKTVQTVLNTGKTTANKKTGTKALTQNDVFEELPPVRNERRATQSFNTNDEQTLTKEIENLAKKRIEEFKKELNAESEERLKKAGYKEVKEDTGKTPYRESDVPSSATPDMLNQYERPSNPTNPVVYSKSHFKDGITKDGSFEARTYLNHLKSVNPRGYSLLVGIEKRGRLIHTVDEAEHILIEAGDKNNLFKNVKQTKKEIEEKQIRKGEAEDPEEATQKRLVAVVSGDGYTQSVSVVAEELPTKKKPIPIEDEKPKQAKESLDNKSSDKLDEEIDNLTKTAEPKKKSIWEEPEGNGVFDVQDTSKGNGMFESPDKSKGNGKFNNYKNGSNNGMFDGKQLGETPEQQAQRAYLKQQREGWEKTTGSSSPKKQPTEAIAVQRPTTTTQASTTFNNSTNTQLNNVFEELSNSSVKTKSSTKPKPVTHTQNKSSSTTKPQTTTKPTTNATFNNSTNTQLNNVFEELGEPVTKPSSKGSSSVTARAGVTATATGTATTLAKAKAGTTATSSSTSSTQTLSKTSTATQTKTATATTSNATTTATSTSTAQAKAKTSTVAQSTSTSVSQSSAKSATKAKTTAKGKPLPIPSAKATVKPRIRLHLEEEELKKKKKIKKLKAFLRNETVNQFSWLGIDLEPPMKTQRIVYK